MRARQPRDCADDREQSGERGPEGAVGRPGGRAAAGQSLARVPLFIARDPVIQGLIDAGGGGSGGGPVSALNAALLTPSSSAHYHYRGSLTTPPFDGPVECLVMRERGTVSQEQVAAIQAINGGEPNNREIQPREGRSVLIVDSG